MHSLRQFKSCAVHEHLPNKLSSTVAQAHFKDSYKKRVVDIAPPQRACAYPYLSRFPHVTPNPKRLRHLAKFG